MGDFESDYKSLSDTIDPHTNLTFLDQGWQKAKNKNRFLQRTLCLLNNPMITPRIIQIILKWLDPLSDDVFFHTIRRLNMSIVAKVGKGTRWEDLKIFIYVKDRLYHDAFSPMQIGVRQQDYFLEGWTKLHHEQSKMLLLQHFCDCFKGDNHEKQMDSLVQIEKTMSDTLFRVVEKEYYASWLNLEYDKTYPIHGMSERLKRLVLQGGLRSVVLDDAVKAFLQTGIDPLSVDGANPQLVECVKKIEEINQNKRRRLHSE